MNKNPFLHALLAALYIVVIVLGIGSFENFTRGREETLLMPMTMISLLVLSVAVMGFLFFSEPLRLFIENDKKGAVTFFGKTVVTFAGFVLVFILILLTTLS
jgi:hypothetical protein